jgi:hypothetical protein
MLDKLFDVDLLVVLLIILLIMKPLFVATLASGLRPKQGFARVWAKKEAQESHLILPGMYESVRE